MSFLQRDGDAGDRILDRAADADLVVGRAQAGRVFRAHGGDELARAQRQIIFSVALRLGHRHVLAGETDIERLERNGALAGRAGDVDLGAERKEGRGKIAGEGRKAHAAALRRDVADGAGGLQAVIIGVTPPFALVVEDAARVEAEIAADRAHVAVGGAGDVGGRLRDHGMMLVDGGMLGDLAQRDRGAELDRFLIGMNCVQFLHAVHVDQHRRCDDAAADVDDEIGAAAERHGLGIICARGDRLSERLRRDDAEFGQGVH